MHNPVDRVMGKIVDVKPNGMITITAYYPDYNILAKRRYENVEIELIDGRPISDHQRKMCYALIGEIADWSGMDRQTTKEALKFDFLAELETNTCNRLFSLANASMSLIAAFQNHLIRFILENDIPTKKPLLEYTDDIDDYLYYCLMSKKCCLCGKKAELHHSGERVGMGRNRNEINHIGMLAQPLCREHHTEAHTIGQTTFNERYHLSRGIAIDQTLARLYRLKMEAKS